MIKAVQVRRGSADECMDLRVNRGNGFNANENGTNQGYPCFLSNKDPNPVWVFW